VVFPAVYSRIAGTAPHFVVDSHPFLPSFFFSIEVERRIIFRWVCYFNQIKTNKQTNGQNKTKFLLVLLLFEEGRGTSSIKRRPVVKNDPKKKYI